MKTIELQDFANDFMQISNNLTLSEIKMLYLLITDKDTRYYTQQEFAEEIGTNRRTINLGFKKLLKYKYIYDIYKADSYTWVYHRMRNYFLNDYSLAHFNNDRRFPSYVRYSRDFVIETMERNISNMVMHSIRDEEIIESNDHIRWLNRIKNENPIGNEIDIVNIDQILRIKGRKSVLTKEVISNYLRNEKPCHYVMIEIPNKSKVDT